MKLYSLLPLKLKRKINAKLRSFGVMKETTRKVATKKSRGKRAEPQVVNVVEVVEMPKLSTPDAIAPSADGRA